MPGEPQPARKLYFVGPVVDFAMIGAVSILAFLGMRLFYTGERTDGVITLALQLSWICNWPHFSATSYRLYHSRENIGQYPLTALLVPLAVLAGILGSFASSTVIAPYFVKLVGIWSPYHFSGQTLGITLIYARRAGIAIGRAERFALSSFIYGTFIAQTVAAEAGRSDFDDHGISYPSLGLPEWAASAAAFWVWAAGAALAVLVGRWCWRNRRLVAPIVLLPAVAQFVWFIPGSTWLSFNEFVPFFHGLQYLLIAWSMQLKEKLDAEGIAPSPRFVAAESLRWGLGNVFGGAMLFAGIPALVSLATGTPMAFATGVIISGVQIHHFFVDGVIWKLKRPRVSSPLMASFDELVGAATPAAQAGRP